MWLDVTLCPTVVIMKVHSFSQILHIELQEVFTVNW